MSWKGPDPVMVDLPAGERDLCPEWIKGIDFRTLPLQPLCLALVERQTGLEFNRSWMFRGQCTASLPRTSEHARLIAHSR